MKSKFRVVLVMLIVLNMLIFIPGCGAYTDSSGALGHSVQNDESSSSMLPSLPVEEPKDLRTDFEKLFDNGPIPAMNAESLWGYIDINGEWVIEPQFESAEMFDSSGHAVVWGDSQKPELTGVGSENYYGYIDINGTVVIPRQYREAGNFNEDGLAFVKGIVDGQGFINEKGETVYDLSGFSLYTGFNADGIAAARSISHTMGPGEGVFGFIDRMGEWISTVDYAGRISGVSSVFDRAFLSSDDDTVHTNDEERYALIDTAGHILTDFIFSDIWSGFAGNGLACVQDAENGLYGYINIDGEYAIPPKFKFAQGFSALDVVDGGLALVNETGNISSWGFVNNQGEYEIPPIYTGGVSFSRHGYSIINESEGLVPIWKMIDTTGKEYESDGLQPSFFDQQGNECHSIGADIVSYSAVHVDMLFPVFYTANEGTSVEGYADLAGNIVIDFQFSNARPFSADGSFARVTDTNYKMGIINNTGEWLIQPEFQQILPTDYYE